MSNPETTPANHFIFSFSYQPAAANGRPDTMGKKSKAARAKAKAGAASSGAPTGGGTSGGAGAMVISSSKKKQNCVRCFGTVKADKGLACPGCSLVYCWRCEKKAFMDCPNGSDCAHPFRRCELCALGYPMLRFLEKKEGGNYVDALGDNTKYALALKRYQQCMEEDDTLSIDVNCFSRCSGCAASECFYCHCDPIARSILSCGSCGTSRCNDCSGENVRNLLVNGTPTILEAKDKFHDLVRNNALGALFVCSTCKGCICVPCMDDMSMKSVTDAMVSVGTSPAGTVDSLYQCSHCYWSTKPCTNPTCPNEVGVPTKRCGGCHIDRYCSVECQLAAYPAHKKRCEKILCRLILVKFQKLHTKARRNLHQATQMIIDVSADSSLSQAEKTERIQILAGQVSSALELLPVEEVEEYFEQYGDQPLEVAST